jgi:large subunit ribosomal protein L33
MRIFLTKAVIFDTFNKASELIKMKDKTVLICNECLSRNYEIKKTTGNTARQELNKYCPKCKKHTLHKESK